MKALKLLYHYKFHHLFFWALLFGGWYYFRYEDYSTREKALLITFIKVADLAILVYFTNYLLIPKLLYKKHYALFSIVFFSMIVISSLLKISLINNILNASVNIIIFDKFFKARIYDNVIPHFLLVSTGAAF